MACYAAGWSSAPFPGSDETRRLAKDFDNHAATLACFATLASTQLALRRLAQGIGRSPRYTATKVGKSDCEGTFAGASGNDEDAPIPDVRMLTIGRLKSTLKRLSRHRRRASRSAETGRSDAVRPGSNDLRLKGRAAVARLSILGWGGAKRACPSGRT
jgi:hypothetical protein